MRSIIFPVIAGFAVGGLLPLSAVQAEPATADQMERICENWLAYVVHQQGDWAGSTDPVIVEAQVCTDGDLLLARNYRIAPRGHVLVPVLTDLPPVKAWSMESDLDVEQATGMARLVREVLAPAVRAGAHGGGYSAAGTSLGQKHDPLERLNRAQWERLSLSPADFAAYLREGKRSRQATVGPLVANAGLGAGNSVDPTNNPLSAQSVAEHIPALTARGVAVTY